MFSNRQEGRIPSSTLQHTYKILGLCLLMWLYNVPTLIAQCSQNCTGTNTFVGTDAGNGTNGTNNSFFGERAGTVNTGNDNSFFGSAAGRDNTSGKDNSFFGRAAGLENETGEFNSFFGRSTGLNNIGGTSNSFYGSFAGQSNTSGVANSFFGRGAGFNITTGDGNIAIGRGAGPSADSSALDQRLYIDINLSSNDGNDNPLIYGEFENDLVRINGDFEVTGDIDFNHIEIDGTNSFFGEDAGKGNYISEKNSFFGSSAGKSTDFGNANSFFGNYAGFENTTGSFNAFFGCSAGLNNVGGASNSFYGSFAGESNTTGRDNSFFGRGAGFNVATGEGNIVIGRGAGPSDENSAIDQRLYIDVNLSSNDGNNDPLIYGEFDNDFVRINGTFEVTAGLTNPSSIKLKDRFSAVAPALILEKINALDIAEWSYKRDPDVRHIGPTAESFYEAFGLGTGGNNISTIDADGVSLVAIQALTEELAKRDQEIKRLKEEKDDQIKSLTGNYASMKKEKDAEISELKDRLARIEAMLMDQK